MGGYNYTILLKDGDYDIVDAIIYTNIKPQVIGEAVKRAKAECEQEGVPRNEQLMYILDCLNDQFYSSGFDFDLNGCWDIHY